MGDNSLASYKKDIIKKEYSSFYKSLANAWEYYLVVKQFSFNGVS